MILLITKPNKHINIMKQNIKWVLLAAVGAILLTSAVRAQTFVTNTTISQVIVTNGITTAFPPFTLPVTPEQVGASVPAGAKQVAVDGYAVFKGWSLTNPISVAFIGLKNGSHYGGGVEAHQILPGSAVSAGFGVFAVQTESTDAAGKTTTKLNFYDATINLGVSQLVNIPVLNLPVTVRLFSGPFASLNGGVLIGAQSGVTGNMAFALNKTGSAILHFGGGVVNCSGAAAAGLKPAMPMADIGFIATF